MFEADYYTNFWLMLEAGEKEVCIALCQNSGFPGTLMRKQDLWVGSADVHFKETERWVKRRDPWSHLMLRDWGKQYL